MLLSHDKRDFLREIGIAEAKPINREEVLRHLSTLNPREYYIYIMLRPDKMDAAGNPVPFYVGLGQGKRVLDHEVGKHKDDNSNNPHKNRILINLPKLGLQTLYVFLERGIPERTLACGVERWAIEKIGRRKNGGPLTNLTDGGEGTVGLSGKDHPNGVPIFVRNIRYDTVAEASRATGIKESAIFSRIRYGWHGYYREDTGQLPRKKDSRAKSVVADGVEYNSIKEASEAIGITGITIWKRIKDGWPGFYYTDEGQRIDIRSKQGLPPGLTRRSGQKSPGVIADGVFYDSLSSVAKAYGISKQGASKRCKSPMFDWKLLEKQKTDLPTPKKLTRFSEIPKNNLGIPIPDFRIMD